MVPGDRHGRILGYLLNELLRHWATQIWATFHMTMATFRRKNLAPLRHQTGKNTLIYRPAGAWAHPRRVTAKADGLLAACR